MGCGYSQLGSVMFVALEGTLVCFSIIVRGLFQILFVAAAHATTNAVSRVCEAAVNRNALAILAVATLRGGDELCRVIYAVRVCRCRRYYL